MPPSTAAPRVGVVNVLTKSGTNDWHGDVRFYFQSSGLDAGPRPTLRRKLDDETQAEYVTYPKDTYNAPEPGFSLGGPIARDKAWLYVSYQPQLRYTRRTVPFVFDDSTGTFNQNYTKHFLTRQPVAPARVEAAHACRRQHRVFCDRRGSSATRRKRHARRALRHHHERTSLDRLGKCRLYGSPRTFS